MAISKHFIKLMVHSAALIVATVSASGQSSLTNGLAAFYPFNGNANDASGNGFNGVVHGATLIADRYASNNCAYRFNGNAWIELPDAIFPPSPPEVTVSLWALADGGPYTSQQQLLIGFTPRTGECGIGIAPTDPSQWDFAAHLPASGWQAAYAPVITSKWTHLVGTFKKGESIQFWVNGSLAQSNSVPDENLYFAPAFALNSAIGIYDFPGSEFEGFRGAIDDVRIYTRVVSPSEIQQLYHAGDKLGPTVDLVKAVIPSFGALEVGKKYQLQMSSDLLNWSDQGFPFVATGSDMVYPQYWITENWSDLYFRLLVVP